MARALLPLFTRLSVSCCPPGAIAGGLSIGPPAKSSIDDSYGRYDLIQNSESPASPPVAVPHSWSRAKSDSDKISNGSSINWPPGKSRRHLCAAADQNMRGAEAGGQLGQVRSPGPPLRVLEALAPYFWLFHCTSVCQINFGCGQCQVLFCSPVVQ